jgi:RimJ/RimL family protein N-acetyltransferase
MLVQLPQDKYHLVYNLGQLTVFPIIASVVYLKQDGKIFVDDIDNPRIVFVIHKNSFSYLYSKDDLNYNELFNFFSSGSDIPQYFHIYDTNEKIINAAQQYKGFNIKIRKRMRMKGPPDFAQFADMNINGSVIKNIDEVDFSDLAAFGTNFIEQYWNTADKLVNEGFGCVIYFKNKPASICYTACVVNNDCEVDILTLPEYRGNGLARLVAFCFFKTGVSRGINMYWDVFTDNIPSIRTAEVFGYKPYYLYDFLSIFVKGKLSL